MTQYSLIQVSVFYILLIASFAYIGYTRGVKALVVLALLWVLFNVMKAGITVGKDLGAAVGAVIGVIASLYLFKYVKSQGMIKGYSGFYR
jgi:hypothetical protein